MLQWQGSNAGFKKNDQVLNAKVIKFVYVSNGLLQLHIIIQVYVNFDTSITCIWRHNYNIKYP